jgi:hypothetical protein
MNAGPIILTFVLCINPLAMLALGFAIGYRVAKHGWKPTIEGVKKNVTRVLRTN